MVDEVKIQTSFIKTLISNVIRKKIRKKIGKDIYININKLELINNGEKTIINISGHLELSTNDIPDLIERLGMM